VQLPSMFEVSFSARQRKNWLFYCLYFLFSDTDGSHYLDFLRGLSDKYLCDVYLNKDSLSSNNRPKPNSFDNAVLSPDGINLEISNSHPDFASIYGDGSEPSKGIQLFVFNYADYKLWKKYYQEMRGRDYKKGDAERMRFFESLGCGDFGLEVFRKFYFSRTRKSLEHFYPQAKSGDGTLNEAQINCFGNFAMIGEGANSSGSDWDPRVKLSHYMDSKRDPVGVASLKFRIMMQVCRDNSESGCRQPGEEWNFDDIETHQAKMVGILLPHLRNSV